MAQALPQVAFDILAEYPFVQLPPKRFSYLQFIANS